MILNLRTKRHVARQPRRARSPWERLIGLMGRREFPDSCDALIFERCPAIHCCFMRMNIDVLFLDSGNKVVRLERALRPWRICAGGRGAATAVELPEGAIERSGTEIGDILNLNSILSPETFAISADGAILSNGNINA